VAETRVATQVRLQLEAQCARAFNALLKKFHPKCDVTLVAFDYAETEAALEYSNLAYKTSLRRAALIELLEARVLRWSQPVPPTYKYAPEVHGWLPNEVELQRYAEFVRALLPESVGFSLFLGNGPHQQYIAAGDREGCAKMFENDLLPGLRGDALATGEAL
jgi:hypothetical protein